MRTILVTGGSGFIGSHAVLQLVAAGHAVRTTARSLAKEGTTLLILRAEYPSQAQLEQILEMGMMSGLSETLGRLDEHPARAGDEAG